MFKLISETWSTCEYNLRRLFVISGTCGFFSLWCLKCMLLLQETDDEDEESCYIKECLHVFLRWLRGLSWFQHLRNKRQNNFDLVWKMISRQICFLLFSTLCVCFCCLVTPINQPPEVNLPLVVGWSTTKDKPTFNSFHLTETLNFDLYWTLLL